MTTTVMRHRRHPPRWPLATLLGPAFVASIAYVDPGNVAANLSAGAEYGHLLVWVLVAANIMAAIVQYLSAKLGLVTGRTLPEHVGDRLGHRARIAYWAQAELVVAATDVAEVIGGALALYILFGIPLLPGGIAVGIISLLLLAIQNRRGQRAFELVIVAFLLVITAGFVGGLLVTGVDPAGIAGGLVPRFADSGSVILAAGMLGATVMPHAIYLHSGLAIDRHGGPTSERRTSRLLRANRWDVCIALVVAGSVNIAMLLIAAQALRGLDGTDTIEGAHAAIATHLGAGVGVLFAVGLLASGLASTSVGSYAGATVMRGLLHVRVPLLARRAVTILPALVILAVGVEPTWALVLSQAFLSIGIPFAIIPLFLLTSDRTLMGSHANRRWLTAAMALSTGAIVILNLVLLGLLFSGV